MAQVKEVDQAKFQQLLASDPEVQAVIQKVWGNTPTNQRPGDTPKHLEKANHQASQEIAAILKAKGYIFVGEGLVEAFGQAVLSARARGQASGYEMLSGAAMLTMASYLFAQGAELVYGQVGVIKPMDWDGFEAEELSLLGVGI